MIKFKKTILTIFTAIFLLGISDAKGQNVSIGNMSKIKIDYIEWMDSAIETVIVQMIQADTNSRNVCEKECGYFVIYPLDSYRDGVGSKSDSIPEYSYQVNIYYYELETILNLNPVGYFLVKDRPVLLLLGDNEPFQLHYSRRQLKKISSLIKYHIPVKKDLKFKSEDGSTVTMKDFSESLVRIHGGKIVNIYADGRVEVFDALY